MTNSTQNPRWINLALIMITLAALGGVLGNGFINYDDPAYVTHNRYIQLGFVPRSIAWAFLSIDTNWFPWTRLSHILDYQIFGLHAFGHHAVNLLLHIVNGVLLFRVLRKMTGELWPSAMVAALFAIHPLHVESVAWVAERKDVLSTLFWLLALGAYQRYAQSNESWKKYAVVMMLFACGLMSKPMVITLPLILILMDYWPLARGVRIGEKLPLLGLSAVSAIVTLIAQRHGDAVRSLAQFPLSDRIANAFYATLSYLGKMIWPDTLSVFYPYQHLALWDWKVVSAFFILIAMTIVVWKKKTSHPYLLIGWGWYLITLIPVIGIVQVGWQSVADRYTYIPLIGPFIMLSWTGQALARKWSISPRVLWLFCLGVLLLLGIRTWFRVADWRDSTALFSSALKNTKDNWLAHHALGMTFVAHGDTQQALYHYARTMFLKPDYERVHNNMGVLFTQQGNYQQAVEHYERALQLSPEDPDIHANLGIALQRSGKTELATQHFRRALQEDPDHVSAHNNLGAILEKKGNVDEAIVHYRHVLQWEPRNAGAHNNVANALVRQGRVPEGLDHYREALRIDPGHADAHYNLGIFFAQQGRLDEAMDHYRQALFVTPRDPDVLTNLAIALGNRGDIAQAVHHLRLALQIKPDHVVAQKVLKTIQEMQDKDLEK